jgi:hypothetical protein
MPFNDDDLHVDDDSEWRPVFGVHTPESEVLELAALKRTPRTKRPSRCLRATA